MKNNPPHKHRGATLLEVITSVGTVVALSTLLLPSLGEARRQGKAVHCLANLGRLGAASAIHATTDPNEYAVPLHPQSGEIGDRGTYSWGGKSGIGMGEGITDPLGSLWGTAAGRGPQTRALNQIIYGRVFPNHEDDPGPNNRNWLADTTLDLDVFHCPSDSGYTAHHYLDWRDGGLTSYDHYGNSYSAVTVWVAVAGNNCRLSTLSSFARAISRVPVAARTVLYLENCGRFGYRANFGNENDSGCNTTNPPNPDWIIDGWHGRPWMFQSAFVDGHAQAVRMAGHLQPEPRLGRYPTFGGFSGSHSFWRCLILRGPGWQLDTLPAPPTATDAPCPSGKGV